MNFKTFFRVGKVMETYVSFAVSTERMFNNKQKTKVLMKSRIEFIEYRMRKR